MSKRELAEILYEACLDMDWMDYEETRDDDIMTLTAELENAETLSMALAQIYG